MLGRFPLDFGADPLRTAALLGRRDNTRETRDEPLPRGFVILVHHGIEQGKAPPVTSASADRLAVAGEGPTSDAVFTDEDYRDPALGYEGRWLAAFAQVGDTDYAVVVQTRYAAISGQIDDLARMLVFWAGLPFLAGALAINLLLFFARRRIA